MVKTPERYEVDPKQLEEMQETIHNLLDGVFGHDCYESPNVEFILIDRERYQSMHFVPLPYNHKEEDLERVMDLALMNLGMAYEHVSVIQRIRQHQRLEQRDAEAAAQKQ